MFTALLHFLGLMFLSYYNGFIYGHYKELWFMSLISTPALGLFFPYAYESIYNLVKEKDEEDNRYRAE